MSRLEGDAVPAGLRRIPKEQIKYGCRSKAALTGSAQPTGSGLSFGPGQHPNDS